MTVRHYTVPVRNHMLRVIATIDVYADCMESAISEPKREVMQCDGIDEDTLNVHSGEIMMLLY